MADKNIHIIYLILIILLLGCKSNLNKTKVENKGKEKSEAYFKFLIQNNKTELKKIFNDSINVNGKTIEIDSFIDDRIKMTSSKKGIKSFQYLCLEYEQYQDIGTSYDNFCLVYSVKYNDTTLLETIQSFYLDSLTIKRLESNNLKFNRFESKTK
jgi:hypothetical protein